MAGGIDYEHELGNGWGKYQIMVLTEMRRLADQGERTTNILQAHEVHLATLGEQNKQRDEALATLIKTVHDLSQDVSNTQGAQSVNTERSRITGKLVGIAAAVTTWAVATGLSFYSAFFSS